MTQKPMVVILLHHKNSVELIDKRCFTCTTRVTVKIQWACIDLYKNNLFLFLCSNFGSVEPYK